jgi:multisubunit Na+/H+ antiporter MnhF subunit
MKAADFQRPGIMLTKVVHPPRCIVARRPWPRVDAADRIGATIMVAVILISLLFTKTVLTDVFLLQPL